MKIYVHYEDEAQGEAAALTLKLTLPKKWYAEPASRVLELFLESYNAKKQPSPPLEAGAVHMEKSNGDVVSPEAVVEEALSAHDDLYIRPGPAKGGRRPAPSSSKGAAEAGAGGAAAAASAGLLRCRNYGCNKDFAEAENSETACRYHTAPPVFHDTKKGWSCCAKRVYDWDEFHLIEGCATGRHSTVDPKEIFAASPTVSAAARADANGAPAPVLKSIEEYNKQNPDAASAAKGAAAAVQQQAGGSGSGGGVGKCTRKADGTATCLNKGCQQKFVVAENHPAACCYHKAAPVFHDAGKFWSCCPGKVKYDFDEFLKIPGCMRSSHLDGSPESRADFDRNAREAD